MATDSGYSHPGQKYADLTQCDSNPSILAKPAHNNSVDSPPRNSEANIRDVGNSSSGYVCHSPQLASSPFYVSNSGASRTGDRCSVTRLAGEVDVHVCTIPTAKQNHSEAQDHSGGRGDTDSPSWLSQPWFHTYYVCVWTTHASFRTTKTYCHNRDMSRAAGRTICMHGGSHTALPSSRIFKRGL